MSFTSRRRNIDRRPSLRRIVGVPLSSIAWMVLACWSFTLLVCAANDSLRPQTQSHPSEAFSQEHADKHSHPDDPAQHEDACCTVLENPSAPSQASDIPLPIFSLAYIVLPFVFVLEAALLAVTRIRFAGAGPPGRPGRTLVANSLWPHAPPR